MTEGSNKSLDDKAQTVGSSSVPVARQYRRSAGLWSPESSLPQQPGDQPASESSAASPTRGYWLAGLVAVELLALALVVAAGVSFDLRSWAFLALLIGLTLTIDVAIVYSWSRLSGRRRATAQVLGVLVISLLGGAVALDLVNHQEGFYASFSDLVGSNSQVAVNTPSVASGHAQFTILTSHWWSRGLAAAHAGHGVVLDARYWGGRSGISRRGYVYLPAAYFVAGSTLRFPVIELLHGQPGGPPNVIRQLGAPGILDQEIRDRRLPPVIGVIPATWTHTFTECVNAVHGEQDETYLAVDVPSAVNNSLRTLPGRTWAIAGYSTGGFCAINLALHHPDLYSGAASLSGYFVAAQDPDTAHLYAGSQAALHRNSPVWWVAHHSPVAPALYLFASAQDPFALRQLESFRPELAKYAPMLPTTSVILPYGGHNWNVWKVGLRPALDWLSRYLPMPLNQP